MAYTLVSFHAHPDDEAIITAGTMMRAKAEGHRVVLVVATRGELGETPPAAAPDDPVADGGSDEAVGTRRVAETFHAAAIMGVDRVEFLGYRDSGMAGEATNRYPGAFAAAPVDDAARRLARILDAERADVLTVYDEHGGYGHPDHVQVHRVGIRAAALAGTPSVLEATIDRDHVLRLVRERAALGGDTPGQIPDPVEVETLGVPAARITTTVDVRPYLDRKRAAMAAHASQIGPDSFFLAMPEDAFAETFGWEWFIRRGAPPGTRETDAFAHVARR